MAALAQATHFAGRAIFLIGNLSVATRWKAVAAWAKGRRDESVELANQAESREMM